MMEQEEALHAQLVAARRHRAGKVSMRTRAMGRYNTEETQVRKRRLWTTPSNGEGLRAGVRATMVGQMGECEWWNGTRVTLSRYDDYSGLWLVRTEAGEEQVARPQGLLADEDEAWEGLDAWRARRGEAHAAATAAAAGDASGQAESDTESDAESDGNGVSGSDSEAESGASRDRRTRRQRQVQRRARTLIRWTHEAWNAAMRAAHGNG